MYRITLRTAPCRLPPSLCALPLPPPTTTPRWLALQAGGPEHILLLNWNQRGPTVLEQLRRVAPEAGCVTVMADFKTKEAAPGDMEGLPGQGRASVAVRP